MFMLQATVMADQNPHVLETQFTPRIHLGEMRAVLCFQMMSLESLLKVVQRWGA